ncbi:MAG TPA: RnfABCDGE type electron transport complex subunit G [bacterium]|nr:RnfABCDGE type electron transport complex subunit G [bacterium]
MRDIIKFGCILMAYTLVVSVALAFVNIKTTPLIEVNKVAAENFARKEVLPGMSGDYELRGEGSEFPYWIVYKDAEKSEIGGYIFITSGEGYSSTIETMIGVDVNATITGVKILFQQEIPGLGAKAEEIIHGENDPWFTRQFKGKSFGDNIKVEKDGGTIDSITGATITSRAITDYISEGLTKLNNIMGGRI